MATTVTIPSDQGNPVKVTINGVEYSFTAGATVSVPDEVAALFTANDANDPQTGRLSTSPLTVSEQYTGSDAIKVKVDSDGDLVVEPDDVSDAIGTVIGTAISGYIDDHPEVVQETDTTLAVSGKPADAKVTGDEISSVKSAIEIVDDYTALLASTANTVLVRHNDGEFGDGGECLFEVRQGETRRTIERSDGSYVAPVLNQGTLFNQNSHEILGNIYKIIDDYVGNSGLTYGTSETLFDTTCSTEIDCSSFVCAVLQGITYNNSRYVRGTSSTNATGNGLFNYYLPDGSSRTHGLNSGELASYFAQHKQLYAFPDNRVEAIRSLQAGDILFTGDGTSETNYLGINHVMLVLGTDITGAAISVAQCGGAGNLTFAMGETTPVKTGSLQITSSNYEMLKAFARPAYKGFTDIKNDYSIVNKLMGGTYYLDINLVQQLYLAYADGTVNGVSYKTGDVTYSKTYCADPCFHPVVEGKTLTCVNDAGFASIQIHYYDENKVFLSRVDITGTRTVPAGACYVRVRAGFSGSSGTIPTYSAIRQFKISLS